MDSLRYALQCRTVVALCVGGETAESIVGDRYGADFALLHGTDPIGVVEVKHSLGSAPAKLAAAFGGPRPLRDAIDDLGRHLLNAA